MPTSDDALLPQPEAVVPPHDAAADPSSTLPQPEAGAEAGAEPAPPLAAPDPAPPWSVLSPTEPVPADALAAHEQEFDPNSPFLPPPTPTRRAWYRRKALWLSGAAGVAAVAVAVALLVDPSGDKPSTSNATPGAHSSATPAPVSAEQPYPEVIDLLERRTAAVKAGDLKAFLADVDPEQKAFVARQKRLFTNLRLLPLKQAVWSAHSDDMTPYVPVGRYTDPVFAESVQFDYQLKGYDTRTVARPQAFTFTQHDGRWWLTSDTDVTQVPHTNGPEIWDVAAIAVKSGKHSLVIVTTKDKKQLSRLVSLADDAAVRAHQMWSGTPIPRVVMYVPRDKASEQAYFTNGKGEDLFDGVEFKVEQQVQQWYAASTAPDVSGNRVVINTRHVKFTSAFFPRLVRHEVAHVATSSWTKDGAPAWLVEGAAEYSAYRENAYARLFPKVVFTQAGKGRLITKLPVNASFYKDPVNYDRMFLLCYYIKTHYGESKLVSLYHLTGVTKDSKKTAATVEKDIKKVLGVTQKQLVSNFNSWAKQNVRAA